MRMSKFPLPASRSGEIGLGDQTLGSLWCKKASGQVAQPNMIFSFFSPFAFMDDIEVSGKSRCLHFPANREQQ